MATIDDIGLAEINVVIIGETGSGKSTLINYLANLFHNGSLNNLKVAIRTRYLQSNMSSVMPDDHEEFVDDITRCKTSQCIKYQFEVKQVVFNFLDTPGINDTGGYLTDNENVENIFSCIQSFEQLTALVLVLNGTQARLTTNIKNVLERFHDRLPDVFRSNIIVILTNCAAHTVNFDSLHLLNYPPIFYMQNSAFSSDPQTWSEETYRILGHDWNKSMTTMNDFIKTLVLLTPISTIVLSEMDTDRNELRSNLHQCRLIIMELQHMEDELIALEQASNIQSQNIDRFVDENNSQINAIETNEFIKTSYHNTICLQCNTVCHRKCSLDETRSIGETVFRQCSVMNNGRCTICRSKCSYDMHYHDRYIIQSKPQTLERSLSLLTNKYNEAKKEKELFDIKYKNVRETQCFIEKLLDEEFNKVQNACLRVQNNCRDYNITEELYKFIELLKNDMNSLRSNSLKNKTNIFINQLESLANESSLKSRKSTHKHVNKRQKRNQPLTSAQTNQISSMNMSLLENGLLIGIPKSSPAINGPPNSENFDQYTTEQLIDLTRQSIEKHVLIAKELNRRCEDTSIGFLSTTQLLKLCDYYASCRLLQNDELNRLYKQLQNEIKELTDSNPLDILTIQTDKILYLTAIKLCLQNTNNTM